MQESVVQIRDLVKSFAGVYAVNGLSMEVHRGEIFGLLGPNGAGKTTTIRILMDIIRPDAGEVCVLGQSAGGARERIGYLPEERGLYRSLRVSECLIYLGQLKGMSHAVARNKTAALLEQVGLSEWSTHKVQELSRGMQQKVQLIASIIHDPDLIILDEPFQGLDPVNVQSVKNLIRQLCDAGKTVLLSAHEMNQVEALCERIALINHGRAVLYGSLADIKKQFSPNAIEISPPLDLDGWNSIEHAQSIDGVQRIYLKQGISPSEFLKSLVERGMAVDRFQVAAMPLDQIFVQVVKDS